MPLFHFSSTEFTNNANIHYTCACPTRLYYVTPTEPAVAYIPSRRTPFLVHTWHKDCKRWLVAVCEQTKPFGCVGVWPWDTCPFSNWVSSYLHRACALLQHKNLVPGVDAFPVFRLHVGGEAFVLVCRGSERLIILLAPVTCLAFCRCQLPGHITATWERCPVTEQPSFTANTVLGHLFYSSAVRHYCVRRCNSGCHEFCRMKPSLVWTRAQLTLISCAWLMCQ